MNQLQHETSPYLLQHADNPVHWYAWGQNAFDAATAADKPILLSIGYSACHWCHVMAHESFEDAATAALMNDLFINVKVDREERPDVDSIYMQAVQAMNTGQGGWPLTVFLTPEGVPFYGGTYFPDKPRHGMPSFSQVLEAIAETYANNRDDVERVSGNMTRTLDRTLVNVADIDDRLNPALLDTAFENLSRDFDWRNGGFGAAPKFPQPMNLEFLLRVYARTGAESALEMVKLTLNKMARGGIYDQVGGGFARYAVDAVWLVPHFEKMLYDNAQLSRLYLHAWQITGDPYYRQIAEETFDYILREMVNADGGFYSATDADSEGVEGKFFVWSLAEIEAILGDDAPVAIAYWGVTDYGNFEGTNILNVPRPDAEVAANLGLSVEALHERIGAIKAKLYAVRAERIPPGLDDKSLTGWNALMLTSLAEAARVLDRADYRAAAIKAADFLLDKLRTDEGRLLRTYKNGISKLNGYLTDHANLIEALLAIYQTTFEVKYFTAARDLIDLALVRFAAPDGGYFDTSDDHEALIVRPRTLQDNALPSGQAVLVKCLLMLTAYTADPRYEEAARATLNLMAGAMMEVPGAFGEHLNAADMAISGLTEVALVGTQDDAATQDLLQAVQRPFRPNIITALTPKMVSASPVPLLNRRSQQGGGPTVYICKDFMCKQPVNTVEDVKAQLG